MKFWVGVTDNQWFDFLRRKDFDEVNFWQPSAKPLSTSLEPGAPFFFKLKAPRSRIGGYGSFVSFVRLPLSLAWEVFGEKNGAPTFEAFSSLIRALCPDPSARDPEIGCTLLAAPRFLSDGDMFRTPLDWSSNIVRGKSYDGSTVAGQELLGLTRSVPTHAQEVPASEYETIELGRSAPYLARARLGQGTFRALLTETYRRRCAITGENILPVLDAAHIRPYSKDGPHLLSNGLLLRSDFHKLFDLGLVTVAPDLRVEVSPRIREEWFNGKAYYRLHGSPLAVVPEQSWAKPGRSYLEWHNEHVFLG